MNYKKVEKQGEKVEKQGEKRKKGREKKEEMQKKICPDRDSNLALMEYNVISHYIIIAT